MVPGSPLLRDLSDLRFPRRGRADVHLLAKGSALPAFILPSGSPPTIASQERRGASRRTLCPPLQCGDLCDRLSGARLAGIAGAGRNTPPPRVPSRDDGGFMVAGRCYSISPRRQAS